MARVTSTTRLALFAAMAVAPFASAQQETVLAVYMFHRHGDRTPKALPPANLTDLGYQEVHSSGQYYHNRYLDPSSNTSIYGISENVVLQSQLAASAPVDTVLTNSAQGFLQGLYPPVGGQLGSQTLANGTNVTAPMDGYQLIPIAATTSGGNSENSQWLQAASGCNNAEISSNEYYTTPSYDALLNSTMPFYQNILGVVNGTFNSSQLSYKNAYTIFDLINVAEIHNATINDSSVLTNETLFQLRTLADQHEFNLAYNASSPARAIAGSTLAAQIVQALNSTIIGKGSRSSPKLSVQFGAYGSFQSFFGLANLTEVNQDFYGVCDYASAMSFELFTNSSASPWPSTDDMFVRFIFNNGTASDTNIPQAYPLFGQSNTVLSWNDFTEGMNKFAVGTTAQWCQVCGNSTGTCAASGDDGSNGGPNLSNNGKSGNGLSPAVNGVIGAMVTLAVILGLEALFLLVGGFRIVSRRRLAGTGAGAAAPAANGVRETKS